ncbi:MAG: DUF4238 domain-containing protein [Patescibacteria group bacterium]|nr:DUF4238 domain-containing protein [Patescibacteria group bacterium]
MTNKPSKKHHYLPRHYLKGFTNSGGTFFVYDKRNRSIFETTPDAVFFENNLNTVSFPGGKKSDFLESAYTHVESESWATFDKIRKSSSITEIDLLDKMSLFFFILCLHWRLPTNIGAVENLSSIAFNKDHTLNYFSVVNKNGKKAPEEILSAIKNSQAFKKSLKLVLPFAPFYGDNSWDDSIGRWRFLYPADGKSWYIVGDNPIVTRGIDDRDPLKCLKEFVFPVSGEVLLVNTNPPIDQGFPPELAMEFNMAIIERAERFVASPRRDWLEALVTYYKFYESFDKTDTIIPNFFEGFHSGVFR